MEFSSDEKGMLWLCACAGLEYRERVARLRAVSRPAELLTESGEEEVGRLLARMEREEVFAVSLLDEDYPALLKNSPSPPLLLFGAGRRELLKARMFCIVGSRITPPWAEKLAKLTAERLSRRFAVVTGLAEGGDAAALEGALAGGSPVCVLPCGIDGCYPAAHASLKERVRRAGLLLTEYPFGTQSKKFHFIARNRILAGLAEGTLVVSAGKRSGALITANFALDGGRDVFAFPHNPGAAQGEGCNELIKKGAYLATGAEDIFAAYGMQEDVREEVPLTPAERRVLTVLKESGELHAAVIAERAEIPVYEAAATLASLELKNLVVKAGGNRYTAV